MPLPNVPNIEPVTDVPSASAAIDTLQRYLQTMRRSFDNAAGNAIDPTSGGRSANSGNAALVIDQPPSNITYTPVVQTNSVNKTVGAFIDISFTLPVRAVGSEVFYRAVGQTQFKQSYANASPYRLIALEPGIAYELQLAGEAANGDLGPVSQLTTVMIGSEQANIAPANAEYVVTQVHTELTTEHVLTPEATVLTVTPATGIVTVGIATSGVNTEKLTDLAVTTEKLSDNAVVTEKLANDSVTTAKRQTVTMSSHSVSLTGTGAAFEIRTQSFTITHTLNKIMLVTSTLTSILGESSTESFLSTLLLSNTVNAFTIRVNAVFFNSIANVTATLETAYW